MTDLAYVSWHVRTSPVRYSEPRGGFINSWNSSVLSEAGLFEKEEDKFKALPSLEALDVLLDGVDSRNLG